MNILGGNSENITIGIVTIGDSHTGDINEEILGHIFIPANTLQDGDALRFYAYWNNATSGVTTCYVKLNESLSLSGATQIAQNSGGRMMPIYRNWFIKDGAFTIEGMCSLTSSESNDLNILLNSVSSSRANIDWSVDQYLILSAKITNTASTVFLRSSVLERLRIYDN